MIIGTAGHIDHGKSALVQALTGRAMDPLAEERRRGITIDLHFAPFVLADGEVAGVIDVPGHEDLVRTMIAGAAGLDLALLVIAADEGIMPQTREHLAILEQLRVARAIPVLTKIDLAEPEWLELVTGEVTEWLRASPIPFAAPVRTSVVTGEGVEALRELINRELAQRRRREPDDLFRLPVDRALSLPGAGTVVTGTAWSGRLSVGDIVRLLPAGQEARVRSLERHGASVTEASPGDRIAVGLVGLSREAVRRGDVLVRAGEPWIVTGAVDAEVELLASARRPLSHGARVRVHLGTAETFARVRLRGSLPQGRRGVLRLALEKPTVARGGDRLVLRSYSPLETIGGGRVLDPDPPRRQYPWPEGLEKEEAADRLRALLARRPAGLDRGAVPVLLGITPPAAEALPLGDDLVQVEQILVSRDEVTAARAAALGAVEAYHTTHPAARGMPLETLRESLARRGAAAAAALAAVQHEGSLIVEGGTVRTPRFQPGGPGGNALAARVREVLDSAGLAPPSVPELERTVGQAGISDALRLAERAGQVVAVERDRFFSAAALATFVDRLEELGREGPITPAMLRDATGLSRKYLIPLLEWADRNGYTRRQGEGRVWLRRPPA